MKSAGIQDINTGIKSCLRTWRLQQLCWEGKAELGIPYRGSFSLLAAGGRLTGAAGGHCTFVTLHQGPWPLPAVPFVCFLLSG